MHLALDVQSQLINTLFVVDARTAKIQSLTALVHEALVSELYKLDDLVSDNMQGLCATGAYILRNVLRAHDFEAEIACARAAYGNVVHYWVLVDGVVHADATYLQFDWSSRVDVEHEAPIRVEHEAPSFEYHGKPCAWKLEGLSHKWRQRQHPELHFARLGLGAFEL